MFRALSALRSAFICVAALLATNTAAAADGLLAQDVEAYIEKYIDGGFIDGVAIGILRGDEMETHAFGNVSPASDVAPNADSVYQIASLTKVFNGVLLALLVQRGALSLDQTLPESFEECGLPANKGRPITLLDLATHHSGLPHDPNNLPSQDPLNPFAHYTPELLCAELQDTLPRTEPIERIGYSNVAMGLLGRIMAESADVTWEELFRREIAKPLAMESTAITLTPTMRERLVMPFDRDGKPMKIWDIPTLEGAGALKSTVNDLLLFLRANLERGNSELDRALAFAREAPAQVDRALAYQGLGWFLKPTDRFYEHTGGTAYSSFFGLQMEEEIGVVVLSNTNSHLTRFIGLRTLRAMRRK